MKRITITFIMVFCVFFLTSCNTFTPEDVEELTEEFCRENPENDICKGSYIDDLTAIGVENLFNALQEDVSNQQDVCDTYISLSNLSLLDDCRQGELTFFPADMDDYDLIDTQATDDTIKNTFKLTFAKDEFSDTIVFTITLVDLDGDIFIEAWAYEYVEVPLDEYQAFLESFETSFNGWALTSEEVCSIYFESTKGLEECILRRDQRMLLDETLDILDLQWVEEETLSFTITLKYTNDQDFYTESVTGSLYKVDDTLYIDMIMPYTISQTEQIAMFNDLVEDMNDTTIDSFTIASEYLDILSETTFIPIREYILSESLTVTDHVVTFGSTYFDFTLSNGDQYKYEVTWDYDDGWVMHWERLYNETGLTFLDKILHVEGFVHGYITSSAGTEYICELYLDDTSKDRCTEYVTIFENGIFLEVTGVGYDDIDTSVEFSVYDSTMTEFLGKLQYDTAFTVVDNAIQMTLSNETIYLPLTETEAGVIVDGFVTDINDRMLSDVDFCDLYGHLFTDCMDFRSLVSMDMMWVTEESFEDDGDGDYSLTLGVYDMMMRLSRELLLDLEVYEDLEENPIIMGRTLSDIIIPPDEEYMDLLTAFLEAYFDDSITEQTLYDDFNEGMEFDGLHAREYILTQGYTYEIGEVTWHADTGFTWYEADLTFTRGDGDITEMVLKYELFPRVGEGKNFRLFYEHIYPDTTVITNYQTKFLLDLDNDDISAESFCEHYFNPWDYDSCLEFVSQFNATNQEATAGLVTGNEFYANFVVDFTAPDTSTSQLMFDLNIVHDILGQVHLLNTIKHPDTALRDSFSFSVAEGIVYGFNTHGISVTTFCDEFADCGTAFEDVTSTIQQVNYGEVYWSFDDYFNPELHALIVFHYFDGTTETHKYSGTYFIDDDDWYIWTLHFIEKAVLD